MADMMVVQSKVKEFNKKHGFRTSESFMEQLNVMVAESIKRSQDRCKSEGMGTLKDRHC